MGDSECCEINHVSVGMLRGQIEDAIEQNPPVRTQVESENLCIGLTINRDPVAWVCGIDQNEAGFPRFVEPQVIENVVAVRAKVVSPGPKVKVLRNNDRMSAQMSDLHKQYLSDS